MKLKLLINDYCLAEQDICPPNFTELLFEDNCTLRKFYVDCIKRKMELECAGMMRGRQCRFVLVAESRVNQILEAQVGKMNRRKYGYYPTAVYFKF